MRTLTRKIRETATSAAKLYWELVRSAASLVAARQESELRAPRRATAA